MSIGEATARQTDALGTPISDSKSMVRNEMTIPLIQIIAFLLLIPALQLLYHDYRKFMSFGPGGTPKTILGYLRVKALGLFALSDPYKPPKIPAYMTQKEGRLPSLPRRRGVRPETLGIAPHRQLDQKPPKELFEKLDASIRRITEDNEHIHQGTSCFEKHGPGIFSDFPERRTCRGEVCHAHPSDGSMHLTLHSADARIMLEAGWGERHPLAKGGWLERFVPGGFVMVYAPRNEDELKNVIAIVRAAAWYVGGEDIQGDEDKRRDSAQSIDMPTVGPDAITA